MKSPGRRPRQRDRGPVGLFAGATVVLAIVGVQVSGIPMLAMMGWGGAIMVAVTMLAAITLLPALLGLAGRRVDSLRIPSVRRRPRTTASPSRPGRSSRAAPPSLRRRRRARARRAGPPGRLHAARVPGRRQRPAR